jgi:hypothetical protein
LVVRFIVGQPRRELVGYVDEGFWRFSTEFLFEISE